MQRGGFLNTFSHVIIGKIIYDYLKDNYGIYLDKKSFIKGNYYPDFSASIIKRPHYIKDTLDYVHDKIEKLANTNLNSAYIDKAYSKKIGIICHYYSDYFCFAHSSNFKEKTKAHISYERKLHKYLVVKQNNIKKIISRSKKDINIDINKIKMKINKYQEDYLNSKQGYGNDLIFSINVCIEMILSVINCSYNLSIFSQPSIFKPCTGVC